MKMHVPKAPWSAVAPATAFPLGIQGGSEAAAVQGASRIFMQRGEPKDHGRLRYGSGCGALTAAGWA
jgi:hypothetical protein